LFNGFTPSFIMVYWLSGFAENHFEQWWARKGSIQAAPGELRFTADLVWPIQEADEAHLIIRKTESGLTFESDWFPEEEFDLQVFTSENKKEMILKGSFERETIFLYLRK
jgi:hypothetical protein